MTLFQRPRVLARASLARRRLALTTLAPAQGQRASSRSAANQFAFAPGRIEVQKDDLVKITFTAADIAHSFTIDQYRIAKRAGAGQTVVFEFRADQAGTHRFYCNLTQDDGAARWKGSWSCGDRPAVAGASDLRFRLQAEAPRVRPHPADTPEATPLADRLRSDTHTRNRTRSRSPSR